MALNIIKHHIGVYYSAITALFLLLSTLSLSIPLELQIYLLLIGSIIIGLPHGALDYDVAKFLGLCSTLKRKMIFFVTYSLIALIYFIVWMYYPGFSLVLFLAISVWHFGEDWAEAPFKNIRRFVFGFAFISLPTLLHGDNLESIFALLAAPNFVQGVIDILSSIAMPLVFMIFIFLGIDIFQKRVLKSLLMLLFLCSGVFLPPLLFLFLYFCAFHAPLHCAELYYKLNYKNPQIMIKNMIPIMLLTLMFFGIAFLFRGEFYNLSAALFSTLIIFIASVTIPHMLLIEYFKNKTIGA